MPKQGRPELRIARFTDALLADDIMAVHIERVPVKVFGVARMIADCFRHRRKVGPAVALEGLQQALRQRRRAPPGRAARPTASAGRCAQTIPRLPVQPRTKAGSASAGIRSGSPVGCLAFRRCHGHDPPRDHRVNRRCSLQAVRHGCPGHGRPGAGCARNRPRSVVTAASAGSGEPVVDARPMRGAN